MVLFDYLVLYICSLYKKDRTPEVFGVAITLLVTYANFLGVSVLFQVVFDIDRISINESIFIMAPIFIFFAWRYLFNLMTVIKSRVNLFEQKSNYKRLLVVYYLVFLCVIMFILVLINLFRNFYV